MWPRGRCILPVRRVVGLPSPANDPFELHDHERQGLERHILVLPVTGAERRQGSRPVPSALDDGRAPFDAHPSKLRPVFLIPVEQQGDARIPRDVAQPRKPARPFGLFVDGDDQRVSVEGVADGHQMRTASGRCGPQAANAELLEQLALPRFQHAGQGGAIRAGLASGALTTSPGSSTVTSVTRTVIAGDFGGTWLRAALVDEAGEILERREVPTPRTTDADKVTREILELVAGLVSTGGPIPVAVCIATAGLVDADRGRVDISPNIPAFRNLSLAGPVRERFGMPAFIENDASAAALGEYRFGAARGVRHLLHATLGTGIGGGIVVNGRLYRGANGLAGEIGHTVIDVSGPRCKCGSRGCLEAMVSGVAFAERARRLIESGKSPLLSAIAGDEPPTGVHLVEAARQGDRVSEAEIRNGGHLLGVAIGGFINILNPDMVTLSGGLLDIGEMLLDPLYRAVRAFGYGASPRTPIRLSELGDDAGLLGAAAVAFERLEEG